jgi:hypothetical protein
MLLVIKVVRNLVPNTAGRLAPRVPSLVKLITLEELLWKQ